MLQCHKVIFYFSTFPFELIGNHHARSHKMKGNTTYIKETKPKETTKMTKEKHDVKPKLENARKTKGSECMMDV